mgnify:FL=1|tara:strand:- start:120 stop:395 length:276 start_codon:yes stop_codon:yes gene_type:complete
MNMEEQLKQMIVSGLLTERDLAKFMNRLTGGDYLSAEQKEELAFLTRDYSYKLDEMLELGLFTEGQIQRAKGKLRKAVIRQIKNNEVREEE